MPTQNTNMSKAAQDAGFANLLKNVGLRVKAARAKKKISRRVLSEVSKVSQRYLAQLESGQGNISIGLLLRIADALDCKLETLLSQQDGENENLARARQLLDNATKQQQAQVVEMLEPLVANNLKRKRIAVIGMRGAGKSTLGKLASQALNVPFVELNDEIEEASGIPIQEIFAMYGPEGYRKLEQQALEQVIASKGAMILAVAGGVVSNPDTFNVLLENFHTIWLKANPEEHMSRVRDQGDERPMAGKPDAMKELQDILFSRQSHYGRADAEVNTAKATLDESLKSLCDTIAKKGFLS